MPKEETTSSKTTKETTTVEVSRRRMVQLPKPGLKNNQRINVKNRNRTPLLNRNNNIPVRITRNHKSSEIPTVPTGSNFSNLVNIQTINSREKPNTANVMNRKTQEMLSAAQRSKLKIAHLNIRSLKNRNRFIQIREHLRDTNYDILALSETWLNSTVTNAEAV